ncbi:hypothetical protein C5E02_14310 [Rathayibacter rathayi]|uniref:Uncharacterized protein n=1 Tax=Rathayibacter rathayi TaxID=33887 RepID=A0ABD6W5D4_RATRA|nr:hypothetical protein [Rathayibacter rathayi]AZZ50271.1 hypothetical protein C1O28_14605 [Rathayibacter rathayi]MWV74431.1 hypothetical protein [Rathayibacter rathayi NCPPB 2980 = VKM Ac-1601]PPF10381.1 hypothetical protein C5C04_13360 [Rathayibacter rathayi]PPF43247.1 hypothetical protein C5C08_14305 [Rathayibacter rathayi]PPF76537.1 hypothetical protein C5C14_13685 [Rathayibacter rathayi]
MVEQGAFVAFDIPYDCERLSFPLCVDVAGISDHELTAINGHLANKLDLWQRITSLTLIVAGDGL